MAAVEPTKTTDVHPDHQRRAEEERKRMEEPETPKPTTEEVLRAMGHRDESYIQKIAHPSAHQAELHADRARGALPHEREAPNRRANESEPARTHEQQQQTAHEEHRISPTPANVRPGRGPAQ